MNGYDYLFETSWEVCNKVGGIHTVVTTKIPAVRDKIKDNYILLGPDLGQATKEDSDFVEDDNIFVSWRKFAKQNSIDFKIGRFRNGNSPIVILVPYTQYFAQKDEIFAEYWEEWQVDSLTGSWDYIEPFLFGYASAKIIESFYNFYLSYSDRIVAQFHEWMTGSGVLYLKKNAPQIATSFTTHATVLGRCLAGNNFPLYSKMENLNADQLANDFNVRAKFSLEKVSASNADVFTTVSEITNRECKIFLNKDADEITPNGFDDSFVPAKEEFRALRTKAREILCNHIEKTCGYRPKDDSLFVLNSGRYEFRNKGIDVFIDALSRINKANDNSRKIVAVIAVPAGHGKKINDKYLTHSLENKTNDPILKAIEQSGINNTEKENVQIVYIPSYLDGRDGVVNMSYFDFLTAFDLTVFPSYYEPWGYTPMESMAFGITSITTTLTGFGLWVKQNLSDKGKGLYVAPRCDDNQEQCTETIASYIREVLLSDEKTIAEQKISCRQIFEEIRWQKLYEYYDKAYNTAIGKAQARFNLYLHKTPLSSRVNMSVTWGDKPVWKKILVKSSLPQQLQRLRTLSQNLWWSWNYDAYELFDSIDNKRFAEMERSPIRLLESLTKEDCNRLLGNVEFMERLEKVTKRFEDYMTQRKTKKNELIAYFSMEFGIHDSLKIFSGGLGMLAGDYLKQASDSNKNIVGVGLLYRYGYFTQQIDHNGEQQSMAFAQRFSHLPLLAVRDENKKWKKIAITLPTGKVYAKIWLCNVGATPLYLLDTDIDENSEQDRKITRQLYRGNNEMRLKQEILLGIGGIRMLESLGLQPTLYHSNEGHSAFSSLERLNNFIEKDKMPYMEAMELIRSSTLFTTHTPVPAGHDVFSEDLMRAYFSRFCDKIGLDWDEFMLLGRKSNSDRNEKFSVSVLAINCSANVNGVSKIHGRVSREMFKYLFDGCFAQEVNIGYVTNGVHLPTWTALEWQELYMRYLGEEMFSNQSKEEYWQNILKVPDNEIWQTHQIQKKRLIEFVKQRLKTEMQRRGEKPQLYVKTVEGLDENKCTIGFARRFATYKRAGLLFTDLNRLKKITDRGVCFIFAGKAHPNDKAGQDLIKRIIEISRLDEFAGKIIFVENYDMYVAKHLVRGCDVWLNTPTRPLEASGTSGEKAVMNGVVNFSVLDGWWAEGYRKDAGWALAEEKTYEDDNSQNILDAEIIYSLLENEVIPTYSNKTDGIPLQWVSMIKNTIVHIAPNFTMKRQLDDYFSKYYDKMFQRLELLKADQYAKAKEYTLWKKTIKERWNSIELLKTELPDTNAEAFSLSDTFKAKIVLYCGEIDPKNIGIELIVADKDNDHIDKAEQIIELTLSETRNHEGTFVVEFNNFSSGVHNYAFRIFPKHELMPFKQDLNLVKWI